MRTETKVHKIHTGDGTFDIYIELNHVIIQRKGSWDYLNLEKHEAKELAQSILELVNE